MTRAASLRELLLTATLAAAMGCSDSGVTRPAACSASLTVAIGRGLQPAIDWQPTCTVASVTVAEAGDGLSLPTWQAWASVGGVTPPVRVGASPSGANVWGAGASLAAGVAYTVYVVRGDRGNPMAGVDSLNFIAQP